MLLMEKTACKSSMGPLPLPSGTNRSRRFLQARDRFGEKPFFFYQDNEQFLFAF
jgi:hypothetical protein